MSAIPVGTCLACKELPLYFLLQRADNAKRVTKVTRNALQIDSEVFRLSGAGFAGSLL